MAILSGVTSVYPGHKEWELLKLLNDQSSDETTSDDVSIENADSVTLFVETAASTSGGVVQLQTAVTAGGPYFTAASITTSAASVGYAVTLAGGDDGMPARYARARIETAIAGGGSIDAYLVIQK